MDDEHHQPPSANLMYCVKLIHKKDEELDRQKRKMSDYEREIAALEKRIEELETENAAMLKAMSKRDKKGA